jgi:hypothetical protein
LFKELVNDLNIKFNKQDMERVNVMRSGFKGKELVKLEVNVISFLTTSGKITESLILAIKEVERKVKAIARAKNNCKRRTLKSKLTTPLKRTFKGQFALKN